MSEQNGIRVVRSSERVVEEKPWGRLVWQVSGELRNSNELTLGRCILLPGEANGRHIHPDCDEVLEVLTGSIVHTWDDREISMERGDAISIPAGLVHNARNVGDEDAELLIVFSTAFRTAVSAE